MSALPSIGSKVRYIGCPPGEAKFGMGYDPDVRWLMGGAIGVVVKQYRGFPAHRCPNHKEYPDCICGEESGIAQAMSPAAAVEYQADPHGVIDWVIHIEDEGETWERIKIKEGT
jgi:hypothetical protein